MCIRDSRVADPAYTPPAAETETAASAETPAEQPAPEAAQPAGAAE